MIQIGTPIAEVLKRANVDFEKTKKIIHGGPMMGITMKNVNVPVLKSTSGLLCLTDYYIRKEYPCLYCGKCAEVCPTQAIYMVGKEVFIREELCRSCGACAEACPKGAITLSAFTFQSRPMYGFTGNRSMNPMSFRNFFGGKGGRHRFGRGGR